jgi:hypothetical protein
MQVLLDRPALLNTRSERQGNRNIKFKDMRAHNGTTTALKSETSHASSVSKVTVYGSTLLPDSDCGEPRKYRLLSLLG